jgi:hypothetical protein
VDVTAPQDEVEHDVLELAAGRRGPDGDDAGEAGEAGGASAARVAGEDVCELAQVHAVQRLGSTGRAAERLGVERGGDVEEGAGG